MKLLSIFLILSLVLCPVIGADTVFSGPVGLKNLSVSSSSGSASTGTDYTSDANCVGAWLMSANNDTETDISSNSANLTQLSGSIPTSADVPSGYSGTSRDFEADDSEGLYQSDGGSTDISGADQPMSICGWFKLESDTGTVETIVSKYDTTLSARQYRITWGQTGSQLEFRLSSNGTSTAVATGATSISTGTWYHFAGVYNDTDIRVYINGSLDSNGASNPAAYTSGIYNGSSQFVIGAQGNGGPSVAFFTDGLIKDVAVYDRALTAEEVLGHYENGINGKKGVA